MTDRVLSFAIVLTGFMLFGSDAMAQDKEHGNDHRVTKAQIKNMTPEQRRAWWKSLTPEQREKIKDKRRARNDHKEHDHSKGKAREKHDDHDHDRPEKHKKRAQKHDDHDH